MIARKTIVRQIRTALGRSRVVVLTGPRQAGKTTLAREFLSEESINYFDLEDPVSLARLDQPQTALDGLTGLIVIDEVQRRPDLFPLIRVLADRRSNPSQFLILGSASGDLLKQSTESLAGRIESIMIGGFSIAEVGSVNWSKLWRRGGMPLSFLSKTESNSCMWRKQFVQTLLERDLPQLGVRIPASALLRFWTILAHYHAQIWNAAPPSQALGVNQTTVRRYLDILTDALMVRQLQPWHANIGKRQVKSPKIYFRDSGILHQLLSIETEKQLLTNPKIGASWEGFVIEQVLTSELHDEAFFWSTHQGAEIDLIIRRGNRLFGIECKRTDAPVITPSISIAIKDLELERVAIIYPGSKRYALSSNLEAVPLTSLAKPNQLFR